MDGEWINPRGYSLRFCHREFWPWRNVPSMYRKSIWEFQLNLDTPLTFRHPDGFLLQPDRHRAQTDLGSIPPPLRSLFPQDEFVRSYILHDSACRDHGLYLSYAQGSPFVLHEMESARVHEIMRESILADGGTKARARVIWGAVRAFGPRW